MIVKIKSYKNIKDLVLSKITLYLIIDNNEFEYQLEIPNNPLVDCDILSFHELALNNVLKKLFKIIKNEEYSNNTITELKKLFNWFLDKYLEFNKGKYIDQ